MIIPKCIPFKNIYNDNESKIFYKEIFPRPLVEKLFKLGFVVTSVFLEECPFYTYDYDLMDELEETNTELTLVYNPKFKKQSFEKRIYIKQKKSSCSC